MQHTCIQCTFTCTCVVFIWFCLNQLAFPMVTVNIYVICHNGHILSFNYITQRKFRQVYLFYNQKIIDPSGTYVNHRSTFLLLYVNHSSTFLLLYVNHSSTFLLLYVNHSSIFLLLYADHSSTFLLLCVMHSSTFMLLYANHSSTFLLLYVNYSSTFL